MGQNRDPLWRPPVLKQGRDSSWEVGAGHSSWECWHPVSGLDNLESGGKLPAMRAVACGGGPLLVSRVHREVLPLLALFSYQWT